MPHVPRWRKATSVPVTGIGSRHSVPAPRARPSARIAVRVMQEIGVDITGQQSKDLKEFTGVGMDAAVTVCDSAKSACPFFPWAKESLHVSFRNPKDFTGSDEEILAGFREVRDEITGWIDRFVAGET